MWERDEDKLALLELFQTGRLRKRSGQADAWELLSHMTGTRRSTRQAEIEIAAERREPILALLNRVWPEWRLVSEALTGRRLQATPNDWRLLQDMLRAQDLVALPKRLNRRTAISAVAPHSKSSLGSTRRNALGKTEITRDGIVRLRPPAGVQFIRGNEALDATKVASIFGEVAITERAMLDGTVVEGKIQAALLVENLGAYQDLCPPEGWLIAHVPGWNTATVALFLKQLKDVPIIHFGDLDPEGVRIQQHLKTLCPKLKWAVPSFWKDYIETRALPVEWPEDIRLDRAPELILDLVRRGKWLEQELIIIDPRLTDALRSILEKNH